MRQKRSLAFGFSAAAVLALAGVIGVGCAADDKPATSGGIQQCQAEDEICDGTDNNCDGVVDEGCECLPGVPASPGVIEVPPQTQSCYSGPEGTKDKGPCGGGIQTCEAPGKWGPCVGEVVPTDGDACDGLDNNCDGMIDEGCECTPPNAMTTRDCYTGVPATKDVGVCHGGKQVCLSDGTWDKACADEVTATDETCDGKDNDCNDAVDDMGMATCGVGACQVTVVVCENAQTNSCVPLMPSKEVCDGIDNDCDQLTDENFPNKDKVCDSGLFGACAPGKYACLSGTETCVPNLSPSVEKCDSIDNDCDGAVDNNIAGTGGQCSTGFPGVCDPGTISCQNGVIDCHSNVPASPEVCDGLDNDCDGFTDENNPQGGAACDTGMMGVCQPGTEKCIAGAIQCIPNASTVLETCDGIDNNCDGQIDENNPGGGFNCSTGLQGACAQGLKNCQNGALVCTPNVMPLPETCDGTDNDCNGVIDDSNPGGGAACSTGLQGICAAGTITCQGGILSCKQNNQAIPEICGNGLDDNCDGMADPAVTVYFSEDFANNSKGWTLGTQWAIGPTAASAGQSYGNPDPALDHTPTADNGVAGVVLGGNASTAIHAAYYLTSPAINLAGAPSAYLEFWRWLNSDYAPYMVNTVDVYNGTAWVNLFTSGGSPGVTDAAWTKQSYNVSAHINGAFQVRFGFSVASGAFTVSQWNVDDIQIVNVPCN